MGIINNMPSKQAVDIDGIIQSYYVYAGENISVGSFVEFIDGVASQQSSGGGSTRITSGKTSHINACVVDTDRVFIMYTLSSTAYARIIRVNDNTITQGTQYTIPYSSSQTWVACCTITTNKVFLASEDSSGGGSAIIANVTGLTIAFVGNGPSFYDQVVQPVRCTLWQPNKVLIHFTRASNNYPMAVLATISNDEITYGSAVTLSSTYYARAINTSCLGWNKQFIFYYSNRSTSSINPGWFWQILYGSGDTLSYTSPSKITDDLTNSITETKTTCCTINPNTILWVAEHYCKLIKVNGNSVSFANETYDYNGVTIDTPFCCLIEDDKVVINYNDHTNGTVPTSIIATINDNIITFGEEFAYNTSQMNVRGDKTTYGYPCCFLPSKGKIALYYLAYGSSTTVWYVYFQVLYASGTTVSKTTSYEKQVRNITQSLCDGLSNTAGSGGTSTGHNETIDIYVPKAGFNLVNNGNFENSLTGWDSTYADVATDATYGNYLACVWNSTNNVFAVNSFKYMTDGKTADKFYMCCNAKGYSTNTGGVRLYCCEQAIDITNNDMWGFYSKTFTASASILNIDNTKIGTMQYSATQTGNKLDITNIRLFNLTKMFGSGNEPDKAWCDEYLGGDIS